MADSPCEPTSHPLNMMNRRPPFVRFARSHARRRTLREAAFPLGRCFDLLTRGVDADDLEIILRSPVQNASQVVSMPPAEVVDVPEPHDDGGRPVTEGDPLHWLGRHVQYSVTKPSLYSSPTFHSSISKHGGVPRSPGADACPRSPAPPSPASSRHRRCAGCRTPIRSPRHPRRRRGPVLGERCAPPGSTWWRRLRQSCQVLATA